MWHTLSQVRGTSILTPQGSTNSMGGTQIMPSNQMLRSCHQQGKWRVGFLSKSDIKEGDEVVWDYKIQTQLSGATHVWLGEWSELQRKLHVCSSTPADDSEERLKKKGKAPGALHRLCYCPFEGCISKSLVKLSNRLAQVHKFNPKERTKYIPGT